LKHREESDGSNLLSPSFAVTPWKKTTIHYHRFLFLKHKKRQNTQENNKNKPREGKEFAFKLMFYLHIFGSHFYPHVFSLLLLSFHFKCFLLVATSTLLFLAPSFALPFIPSRFKLS